MSTLMKTMEIAQTGGIYTEFVWRAGVRRPLLQRMYAEGNSLVLHDPPSGDLLDDFIYGGRD